MAPLLPGPAIALIELESIARGMVVADAVVKRAPVALFLAEATTPGKYLLLFGGGVAEVEEAFAAGIEAGGATVLDRLFLAQAAEPLREGLQGRFSGIAEGDSVGIIETHTVASGLLAADAALKGAEVGLQQLQLARSIGGKAVFTVHGELSMVEAALEAGAAAIESASLLAAELIRRPHPELAAPLFSGSRTGR